MGWFLCCALIYAFALFHSSMAVLDMNDFFPNIKKNLTMVTWAHAVNNRDLLYETFRGGAMMIEADIILGTVVNETATSKIPIMGHPPATTSDMSLKKFLGWVMDHNKIAEKDITLSTRKGIKLDFKSIYAFEASIPIIQEVYEQLNYPVWINADILRAHFDYGVPVDPQRFFNGTKYFTRSIISVGWSTTYGGIINNLAYSMGNMEKMLDVIRTYSDNGTTITFPVRAGMLARSRREIKYLMSKMPKSTTLTIWYGHKDEVRVPQLRNIIFSIGVDRVFIDLPEHLLLRLDLGNSDTTYIASSSLPSLRVWKTLYTLTISALSCLVVGILIRLSVPCCDQFL